MTDPTRSRRAPTARTWSALAAGLAAILLVLILIAVACSRPGSQATGGEATSTPGGSGALASAAAGTDGGHGDDGAPPGAPATAPPAGPDDPGTGPDPVGPTIEDFQVTQQPQCPGGTTVHPVPAQPVTLEWKVVGADGDQVSLSIDGPGVYNTYPAEGGDTINFPCEGEEGDTQEHTYLLTATGDGVTATETLVVTAEVQEVTDVP